MTAVTDVSLRVLHVTTQTSSVGFRRHMLTTNSSKSNASFRHFSDDKVQDVFSKQIKGKYNGDEINTESRMLIYGFTCQQAFNSL